jgi:pyrroloquinoline quinone biosynthesis protein B
LAVSGDGSNWYLVNASPDLRTQLLSAPELRPGPGRRQTPIRGVLLTSAELDHVLGLLQLREATELAVYSTEPVRHALTHELAVSQVMGCYTQLTWHSVQPGTSFILDGGLHVTAAAVSTRAPRYVPRAPGQEWVVAYRLHGRSGRGIVYAPCLPALTQDLLDLVRPGDLVLADGTFYTADEMGQRAGAPRDAQSMGHLPVHDSLPGLLDAGIRPIYTHLNNTNPLCSSESLPWHQIVSAGASVAEDGHRIAW